MDDDFISQIRDEMAEEGQERTPEQVRRWFAQHFLLFVTWLRELSDEDPHLVRKLLEPTTLDEKRELVAELADQGLEISLEFIDQVRETFNVFSGICADGEEDEVTEKPHGDG